MKSLILLALFTTSVFAQKDQNSIIRDFLRQRQQMIKEMEKAFDSDVFGNSMDDSINESMSFGNNNDAVKVERISNEDGTIDLKIIPKSKDINFDIETKNNMVTIKGKSKVEEEKVDEKGNKSTRQFESSFQKSYSIPFGYDAKPATQVGKAVVIKLVPKNKNFGTYHTDNKNRSPRRNKLREEMRKKKRAQRQNNGRVPIKPRTPGDITN